MKVRNVWLSVVCALAVFSGAVRAADEGSVKGVIHFSGDIPEVKNIDVPAKDQGGCGCKVVENDGLIVDKASKGIKDVIIRVLDVKAPEPKEEYKPLELDQKGCKFTPHITIVKPGSPLTVLNPDKIVHNIHTIPLDLTNDPMNNAMQEEKRVLKANYFKEPEIIQVQCDMHPWMKGFIVVHDPRFVAVTGTDGVFEIKGLPPGKYKVNVFHGNLGQADLEVEVKAGAASDMGEVKLPKK